MVPLILIISILWQKIRKVIECTSLEYSATVLHVDIRLGVEDRLEDKDTPAAPPDRR